MTVLPGQRIWVRLHGGSEQELLVVEIRTVKGPISGSERTLVHYQGRVSNRQYGGDLPMYVQGCCKPEEILRAEDSDLDPYAFTRKEAP